MIDYAVIYSLKFLPQFAQYNESSLIVKLQLRQIFILTDLDCELFPQAEQYSPETIFLPQYLQNTLSAPRSIAESALGLVRADIKPDIEIIMTALSIWSDSKETGSYKVPFLAMTETNIIPRHEMSELLNSVKEQIYKKCLAANIDKATKAYDKLFKALKIIGHAQFSTQNGRKTERIQSTSFVDKIFTTNYDPIFEAFLRKMNWSYSDGFDKDEQNDLSFQNSWIQEYGYQLIKLHPRFGGNIQDALVANFVENNFGMISLNKLAMYFSTTNATSAEDYLKSKFQDKSELGVSASDADGYTFVNDNQTTIGKNHEAWQTEYTRVVEAVYDSPLPTAGKSILRELTIYAINEGRVYRFEYTAEKEKFSEYLPAARKVLDSIEFIPIPSPPPEKIPSFMR